MAKEILNLDQSASLRDASSEGLIDTPLPVVKEPSPAPRGIEALGHLLRCDARRDPMDYLLRCDTGHDGE